MGDILPDSADQTVLQARFSRRFLDEHSGKIISDPKIALVELLANCWDAGARNVNITWPLEEEGYFEIRDDGIGMSKNEFELIWPELNYNRVENTGACVTFPEDLKNLERPAYGRNGKGRHSLFCFADTYNIETWKDNKMASFFVKRSFKGGSPYEILFQNESEKEGHGTKIYCDLVKNYIETEKIKELLGSKFITDPDFTIFLNSEKINLFDLNDNFEEYYYEIPDEGEIRILRIDSRVSGRTSRQHGIAWWVNKRLVSNHSWKGIEGAYLDGRTHEAKRYTFIVEADILANEVKADWTGFKDTKRANSIVQLINEFILESIQELMQEVRQESKKNILTQNRDIIKPLSNLSKEHVGKFVDKIQMKCPTMSQKDLSNAIRIFSSMELNRSGYGLLTELTKLSPDDLDGLNDILENWNFIEAKKVLDELDWRLKLIDEIEQLVEDPETNELHELQPLFEKGLWIFGPEYEGIQFTSNQRLSTVIETFFAGGTVENPLKRPDFVALPDSSIGLYTSDRFENGEVCGIQKVLIVELKKGGSTITKDERRQAEDYADEIINCGKIEPETTIMSFVLGSNIECGKADLYDTRVQVIPKTYDIVLRQAHARTFQLKKKIKEVKGIPESPIDDKEMVEVFNQSDLGDFN